MTEKKSGSGMMMMLAVCGISMACCSSISSAFAIWYAVDPTMGGLLTDSGGGKTKAEDIIGKSFYIVATDCKKAGNVKAGINRVLSFGKKVYGSAGPDTVGLWCYFDQKFTIEAADDGYFYIKNNLSKYLSIWENLGVYCDVLSGDKKHQQWQLTPVEGPNKTTYMIMNRKSHDSGNAYKYLSYVTSSCISNMKVGSTNVTITYTHDKDTHYGKRIFMYNEPSTWSFYGDKSAQEYDAAKDNNVNCARDKIK